jgi:hypothetical protein
MSLTYGGRALAGALILSLGVLAAVTAREYARQAHPCSAGDWSWHEANVDAVPTTCAFTTAPRTSTLRAGSSRHVSADRGASSRFSGW